MNQMERIGRVVKINGNMVTIETPEYMVQNEVAYISHGDENLKAEVIRVRGDRAETQVFESTGGLCVGDQVKLTGDLLSWNWAPAFWGRYSTACRIPARVIREVRVFLKRGEYLSALPEDALWEFNPLVKEGIVVRAGDKIGFVPEKIFKHYIMVPFGFRVPPK
jgi:V/A-type H+-transporting ATPase subunit A